MDALTTRPAGRRCRSRISGSSLAREGWHRPFRPGLNPAAGFRYARCRTCSGKEDTRCWILFGYAVRHLPRCAVTPREERSCSAGTTTSEAGSSTQTRIRVTNGPVGTSQQPHLESMAGVAQCHGLVGMRERAAMLGGTLKAGPTANGGFEVVAILPLEAR